MAVGTKVLRKFQRMFEEEGVTLESVTQNKHLKFRCSYEGQPVLIVASATASDHRAFKNVRRDVRREKHRVLQSLGRVQ